MLELLDRATPSLLVPCPWQGQPHLNQAAP